MPELPEVESIRTYLIESHKGKTIRAIDVHAMKQIMGDVCDVTDTQIVDFKRLGKVLLMHLSNDSVVQIHLKMSGHLSLWPNAYTRASIHFHDAETIYFNDPRRFGWIKIDTQLHVPSGIDCLDDRFTAKLFRQIIERSRRNIKSLLLDQSVVAGIGNIYANDALWEASISPYRSAHTLTTDEGARLYDAICLVIAEGIQYGGSSKTYVYRLPDGRRGSYQDHFRVYDQEGEQCKRCGTIIKRVSQSGRSTWFCTTCQI